MSTSPTPPPGPADAADQKRVDLVFEGGGVKGIGLAGAFSYLDEQRFQPQRVAGTSAGAITAALVAAGYGRDELQRLVLEEMKFKEFEDGHHWPIGEAVDMLGRKGLHPGAYFEGWMTDLLKAKGMTKFGDLSQPADTGDEGLHYRLQVIASDVSEERMLVLPRDARTHLGIDPDEFEIAKAVRMSMSIPIFFEPVTYVNPQNPQDEHLIVDGGVLSNFPVWLFDSASGQVPRWPTFGLLLVAPDQHAPLLSRPAQSGPAQDRLSILGFLLAIGRTMMEAHDRLYVAQANYARTIPIDTLGVQTTQFSIDDDQDLKQRLFQSGRDAATEFLKTWDFDAYIKAFHTGEQTTRRQRVARALGTDDLHI
jgi:NTE family protein